MKKIYLAILLALSFGILNSNTAWGQNNQAVWNDLGRKLEKAKNDRERELNRNTKPASSSSSSSSSVGDRLADAATNAVFNAVISGIFGNNARAERERQAEEQRELNIRRQEEKAMQQEIFINDAQEFTKTLKGVQINRTANIHDVKTLGIRTGTPSLKTDGIDPDATPRLFAAQNAPEMQSTIEKHRFSYINGSDEFDPETVDLDAIYESLAEGMDLAGNITKQGLGTTSTIVNSEIYNTLLNDLDKFFADDDVVVFSKMKEFSERTKNLMNDNKNETNLQLDLSSAFLNKDKQGVTAAVVDWTKSSLATISDTYVSTISSVPFKDFYNSARTHGVIGASYKKLMVDHFTRIKNAALDTANGILHTDFGFMQKQHKASIGFVNKSANKYYSK